MGYKSHPSAESYKCLRAWHTPITALRDGVGLPAYLANPFQIVFCGLYGRQGRKPGANQIGS